MRIWKTSDDLPSSATDVPEDASIFVLFLTKGYVTLIDLEDVDRVLRYKWCITENIVGGNVHPRALGRVNGELIYLNQFIKGKAPGGLVTDHVNGNPLDNRKINLEFKTQRKNCQNSDRYRNGKGYSYQADRKAWICYLRINGKRVVLGRRKTEVEAKQLVEEARANLANN